MGFGAGTEKPIEEPGPPDQAPSAREFCCLATAVSLFLSLNTPVCPLDRGCSSD